MLKETYNVLQKNRKKIKIRSILLAGFMMCVNAYAWFIFSASANGNINADIVEWSVNFYENNEAIKEFDININNMYPGMPNIVKSIIVRNDSDIEAVFNYEISALKVFDHIYEINSDFTSMDAINKLESDYPFSITFNTNKNNLNNSEAATFNIVAEWVYENVNYYKLNSDFIYVPYFMYYDVNHNLVDDVTDLTNLYIEGDDADTYFSEKCTQYKIDNPTAPCLSFHINLKVTQKSE